MIGKPDQGRATDRVKPETASGLPKNNSTLKERDRAESPVSVAQRRGVRGKVPSWLSIFKMSPATPRHAGSLDDSGSAFSGVSSVTFEEDEVKGGSERSSNEVLREALLASPAPAPSF